MRQGHCAPIPLFLLGHAQIAVTKTRMTGQNTHNIWEVQSVSVARNGLRRSQDSDRMDAEISRIQGLIPKECNKGIAAVVTET
jgi:hypothetical protein